MNQVQRVSQCAGVSEEEARLALAQAEECPLDAVLLLERQGKAVPPTGGNWSTRPGEEAKPQMLSVHTTPGGEQDGEQTKGAFRGNFRRYTRQEIVHALKSLLRGCLHHSVDIWRGDDLLVGIPVIVCVILIIVCPQIMLPLIVIGLALGCRYRLSVVH